MSLTRIFQLRQGFAALASHYRRASALNSFANVTSIRIHSSALHSAAALPGKTFQALQLHRGRYFGDLALQDSEATDLTLTDAAVERLRALSDKSPEQPTVLRLTVEGGGCSGFSYLFGLDSQVTSDDRVISRGGTTLVCDTVSYEFIRGATIDYVTEMVRSAFEVTDNPNASQSCGCGSSFSPKS